MGGVPGEERCQGPQKGGGEEKGGVRGEGKEQQTSRFLKSCSERAPLLGWGQGTADSGGLAVDHARPLRPPPATRPLTLGPEASAQWQWWGGALH